MFFKIFSINFFEKENHINQLLFLLNFYNVEEYIQNYKLVF
jgi:hypothetical protein